jgi:hypothetical protein
MNFNANLDIDKFRESSYSGFCFGVPWWKATCKSAAEGVNATLLTQKHPKTMQFSI